MRPVGAWALVAGLVAWTAAALTLPALAVGAMAVAAWLSMRRGRPALVVFFLLTAAVNGLLLGWLDPGPRTVAVGPMALGVDGVLRGVAGAARITAILGANLAVLSRTTPAAWLDGLRLPSRAQAFLAAILIASHDLARDHRGLRDARRLEGGWPERRLARVRIAAAMLIPLLVAAHERARVRRDALRLAGIDTGPRFAPVVAVTALAVAGRLALVALPNVSLTYVVVFAGGLVFGATVGAWAGAWSMLLTDLLLSGLTPTAFVNVPAMALVGAAGGLAARFDWTASATAMDDQDREDAAGRSRRSDAWAGRLFAASLGILLTFLFSIAADTLDWLIVPEFRASADLLRIRILAGLTFNVVPAITNAFLFAWVAGPVQRAFAALRSTRHPM